MQADRTGDVNEFAVILRARRTTEFATRARTKITRYTNAVQQIAIHTSYLQKLRNVQSTLFIRKGNSRGGETGGDTECTEFEIDGTFNPSPARPKSMPRRER